jgi:hypothetical protein
VPLIGDAQLQAWAQSVPGAGQLIASVTDDLTAAVEVLEEQFGPIRLTMQGSYARSTAVPGSDMDFLLYRCDTPAAVDTAWGDPAQRRHDEFLRHAEAAIRGWYGVGEAPRRAIWTRIHGVEVHVLPVLRYQAPTGEHGAWFCWASGVEPTITFSELVTERINERDADTGGRYCQVVRVFKNLSEVTYMESGNLAGSSVVEGLVYAAGAGPVSEGPSLRVGCVSVLEELARRLEGDDALTITDPSGMRPLFDGNEDDPEHDQATTFVWEALGQLK